MASGITRELTAMKRIPTKVIKHSEDHYEFLLEDCEIYYTNVINFAFLEITTEDRELKIHVPGPGEFISEDVTHQIDGEDASTLKPLQHLVGAYCLRLHAMESGHLEVTFSNGDILKLPPDEQYENWEFRLSGTKEGWWIGASPGGGIWVFGQEYKQDE